MSETSLIYETEQILPEIRKKPAHKILEDKPCPVCGKVCPNDMYCINCGFVYDPVLKKYQTPEMIKDEKANRRKFRLIEAKRLEKSRKNKRGGKQSKHQSRMVEIGREFKRQFGRAAEPGEAVRRKNLDGSYNKSSIWYIKTPRGWRGSPSKTRKPTVSQIKRVCRDA